MKTKLCKASFSRKILSRHRSSEHAQRASLSYFPTVSGAKSGLRSWVDGVHLTRVTMKRRTVRILRQRLPVPAMTASERGRLHVSLAQLRAVRRPNLGRTSIGRITIHSDGPAILRVSGALIKRISGSIDLLLSFGYIFVCPGTYGCFLAQ